MAEAHSIVSRTNLKDAVNLLRTLSTRLPPCTQALYARDCTSRSARAEYVGFVQLNESTNKNQLFSLIFQLSISIFQTETLPICWL